MKLAEKITCLGYGNILQALKDSEVDETIKSMIATDKLQVVDQSNTVIFDRELKDELNIMAKSPFRSKNPVYDLNVKVSDLSSKTKT